MDFASKYLNKVLEDLTYEDLTNYFREEKEESDRIEFKSFSKKYGNIEKNLEGVIRGICALLNSEGGILIWGAPEGVQKEGRREKVFLGELSPVDEYFEKDKLINKVSDSITPLPVQVNLKIVDNSEGGYIYIFEIQQSSYRPHQYKSTYFARLDGQTKPAPHYLIEALFRQVKYPNIEGFIKLESIVEDRDNLYLDLSLAFFNFSALQNEENVFYTLISPNGNFAKPQKIREGDRYLLGGRQLVSENFIKIFHFGAPHIDYKSIIFDLAEISKKDFIVELILNFGGKFSPLKISRYKIDLNNIDWNRTKEPNYLIVETEENILAVERQSKLGVSREFTLKEYLKR